MTRSRTEHPVTVYARVLNLLLEAQHAFSRGNQALGTSCLVAAEQDIPLIDGALQFLQAQTAADKIWKDYLIQGGLEKSGEFKIQNYWSVA